MVGISWVNVVLGAWLALAPWVFSLGGPAGSNSMLSGLIVLLFAVSSLVVQPDNHLPAWANVAAGTWVLVSPWVIGFSTQSNAMWTHAVAGGLIAIVALIRRGAHGPVTASSRV